MRLCYERYIRGAFEEARKEVIVLDLGALNVNGSYKPIFSKQGFRYIGADLVEGRGVDLLLADPYKIPLPNASVDIVLSGQMLEHCEFFWLSFVEMCRVVKPEGYIFLIAPSAGEIHRYPVDCYRFLPDSFYALAKYASCHAVAVWRDERLPWKDLVGVFRRSFPIHEVALNVPEDEPFHVDGTPPGNPEPDGAPSRTGGQYYLDVLKWIHERLAPRGYLEVGVRQGHSLSLAQCQAVGIDPAPNLNHVLRTDVSVALMTSDEYFAVKPALPGFPVDLAFIDGMHAFEYVLRDFINIERRSNAQTLVIIDDVLPRSWKQAERVRRTSAWTGDVWKIVPCLRQFRPELTLLLIDSEPTGLLLIAGLDSNNNKLWSNYNLIVKNYVVTYPKSKMTIPLPSDISPERELSPNDPRIADLLDRLKTGRVSSLGVVKMAAELAQWGTALTAANEKFND